MYFGAGNEVKGYGDDAEQRVDEHEYRGEDEDGDLRPRGQVRRPLVKEKSNEGEDDDILCDERIAPSM